MFENIFGNKKCKIETSNESEDSDSIKLLNHYVNKIDYLLDNYRSAVSLFNHYIEMEERIKIQTYNSEIVQILNEIDNLMNELEFGLFYKITLQKNICDVYYIRSTPFIYLKDFTRFIKEGIILYKNGVLNEDNYDCYNFLLMFGEKALEDFNKTFYRECEINMSAQGYELQDIKTKEDLQDRVGGLFNLIEFAGDEINEH